MTTQEPLGEFVDRYTTRFARRYGKSAAEVWRALTEPSAVTLWFTPEPAVDFKIGGRWTFVTEDNPYFCGTVTAYEPQRRIEYSYDSGPVMAFELESAPDGCNLFFDTTIPKDSVPVAGFVPDGYGWSEQPAGPGTPQPALNASWHSNLDGLRQYLDGSDESAITAAARREREKPDEWRSLVDAYRDHISATAPSA